MRSLFVRNPCFVSTFKSSSWIHHQIKLHQSPKPPVRFSPFSSNHHLQFSATEAFKPSISNFSAAASSMGAVLDEEGLSRRFWIKFQKESAFSVFSPFVVCLASGRLESEAFRHYIAQDVHFLRAFVQAYEMAEECADDDDDKDAICELKKGVLEAMRMHDSFVQEWGIDLAKETTPNSATVKYTGFLLATASGKVEGGKDPGKIATPFEKTKIAAYTLGAMTPCMRLYAFLGKKLQPCLDPVETSPLYRKWIDKYASESFESAAQQTEDLLDKLSISLTGGELKVIEGLYHQALKLEIEFFSAQPIVQRSVVPLSRVQDPTENHLVIFSDFDLTCTVVDSSAILAEIAILTAPKSEQNGPEDLIARKSSADLRNSWDVLSSQYAEEHEQCIESIMPSEPAEAFNYEGLCKALDELSDFERRANSRVIESGVLKGLNSEDIKRAGERLVLQDGCTVFFQQLVKRMVELNADVHILSYCWCGDLIRSAFSSGIAQIVPRQADVNRHESIHDFIERLFSEKDHEDAPPTPKVDDITKRIKVDVVDFSGRLNPQAFIDWLNSLEDYFNWYRMDDAQRVAFVKVNFKGSARARWHGIDHNNFVMGSLAITRWDDMREKLESKYLPSNYLDILQQDFLVFRQGTLSLDEYTEKFNDYVI